MPNIKDVAKQAGVSIATVSRVINNTKTVSPAARVKVEKAIRDLNYHANEIARGLKVSKTNRIATIITSLSRTFFSPIIEGIDEEAAKHDYSVLIAETHDNIEQEVQLVDYFARQWVDGIILASSINDDERASSYISRLGSLHKKEFPIPVVTLEFPLQSNHIDAVSINNEKAAFDAVTYLIRQVHRRNIVHISHPYGHRIGDQRIQGYQRALRTADQADLLETAENAVDELLFLWKDGAIPACVDILKVIKRTNLFSLNDRVDDILSKPVEDEDKKVTALRKALIVPFNELEKYSAYVTDNTQFATHQGVKGLEFPRVMVIMDDTEAKGFLFSYEKLFGATSKTETDIKNERDGKDTGIMRTTRLFYVACTRAEKSLAVVAYTENKEAVKNTAISNGWFSAEEIELL